MRGGGSERGREGRERGRVGEKGGVRRGGGEIERVEVEVRVMEKEKVAKLFFQFFFTSGPSAQHQHL